MKVGDHVKWTSQAQGFEKIKEGIIAEVVQPGERPNKKKFEQLYRNSGCGYGRSHVSYVVLVNGKAYWPVVKNLIKV